MFRYRNVRSLWAQDRKNSVEENPTRPSRAEVPEVGVEDIDIYIIFTKTMKVMCVVHIHIFDDDHVAAYAKRATTDNDTTVAVPNISYVGATQTVHMLLALCIMPFVK